MRHVLLCLVAALSTACLETPPEDTARAVSTPPADDAIVANVEELDAAWLADLELASNSKKCVVANGDCTCPAAPKGMKVKDTLCEGNVLTCGKQGFCTYVRDRGSRADAADVADE